MAPDLDGASGRARVRALLWQRLDGAGLARAKGQGAEDAARMRERLTERLAYMAAENIETLAGALIDAAAAGGGQCPSEVVILGFALGLQAEPLHRARIVTSWLASVEGPAALAEGYAVALLRWLVLHRRPPVPFDLARIRQTGQAEGRHAAVIAERVGREVASPEDRAWLAGYERDLREVRQIVAEGAARRAEGQGAGHAG